MIFSYSGLIIATLLVYVLVRFVLYVGNKNNGKLGQSAPEISLFIIYAYAIYAVIFVIISIVYY